MLMRALVHGPSSRRPSGRHVVHLPLEVLDE
jgi:hypothetical protein